MAMSKRNTSNDAVILNTLEGLVPQNHLVRKLESCIDWQFIYPLVEKYYSTIGRPSIDPVILFKMVFIDIIFGIHSMRRTCEEIQVNIAYRWFLGISMEDTVPNYSTWSQNYIRRFKDTNVFDEIFDAILKQAIHYGYIDLTTVFGDSTHQKASANKNKYNDKEIKIAKKIYEDELLEEINNDREAHGKKKLTTIEKEEINFDEEKGTEKVDKNIKHIKKSKIDPESGLFHKGEKEKCFAYCHQTFCDRNGFVLASVCVPGNVHDSTSFFTAYNVLNNKFKKSIKNICLDAGYVTPAICREVIRNDQTPYFPYKRPMTKKGFFKKYEYVYDEQYDCYLCPNDKVLKYTTTNKSGYREYKSDPAECMQCPFRNRCTKSKNMQKVIMRHVWEDYKETANEIRYTPEWKKIYPMRKESIERVFADCKEQHNLRYTRLRGIKKNQHQVLMIFACHNLKRMAKWRWKSLCHSKFMWKNKLMNRIILFYKRKEKQILSIRPALSTI